MDEIIEFVTEAEGILPFVTDANINQTYSLLSIAAGGVRLQGAE